MALSSPSTTVRCASAASANTFAGLSSSRCARGDATAQSSITLAHIFSHCGYPLGDVIDEEANKARGSVGSENVPLWLNDELAVRLTKEKKVEDAMEPKRKKKARNAPAAQTGDEEEEADCVIDAGRKQFWSGPCAAPRGLNRRDERLLHRFRTSACPEIGNVHHERPGKCKCCGTEGVMGRSYKALRHMIECPMRPTIEDYDPQFIGFFPDDPAMLHKAVEFIRAFVEDPPEVAAVDAAAAEEEEVEEEDEGGLARLPSAPPPPSPTATAAAPPSYAAAAAAGWFPSSTPPAHHLPSFEQFVVSLSVPTTRPRASSPLDHPASASCASAGREFRAVREL